jgi:REP element-mobilizing transposase RayT
MRYRDYKQFRANNYYHVYNRGNNKQPIFLDDSDFLAFLKRLKLALGFEIKRVPLWTKGAPLSIKPFPAGSFEIIAYCLMSNHYHFLIKQCNEIKISNLIGKVCTSYSMYFNKKYARVGSLFQDQFKAKLVEDDAYLVYLSAYIHNNPENPLTYSYSSLQEYITKDIVRLCENKIPLEYFDGNRQKYKAFVIGFSSKEKEVIESLVFD